MLWVVGGRRARKRRLTETSLCANRVLANSVRSQRVITPGSANIGIRYGKDGKMERSCFVETEAVLNGERGRV